MSYSAQIDADALLVTLDGTEYVVNGTDQSVGVTYGDITQSGVDYSNYPFAIMSSNSGGNTLFTETAGTHSIKIETYNIQAETTPCFDEAVKSAMGKSKSDDDYTYFTITNNNGTYTASIDVGQLATDIINHTKQGNKYVAIGDGIGINNIEFRYSGNLQNVAAHIYFSAIVQKSSSEDKDAIGTFKCSQSGAITYTETAIG